MQHGFGIEIWIDSSRYEGEYFEGKKTGKGTYIWADGCSYTGEWADNQINGKVLESIL